jgi:hypothetical protein
MTSNTLSRNREAPESRRDADHQRVAGLIQAAGLFDHFEYSDQFDWGL